MNIIEMAKEAGFTELDLAQGRMNILKDFATLVAAHEREGCAKVAERFEPDEKCNYVEYASAAIRARGEK